MRGIAACVPKAEVANADFPFSTEKEKSLFIKTVGIEKRRVAKAGVCTSDLCFEAATKLIDDLQWEKSEIDVLLLVTQTPDYITPPTSVMLQNKLGLPTSCIAYDINLGCSGYVNGIALAAALLNALGKGKALLLAGDISSATISTKDKSTTPIFSDAGSATALEFQKNAAPFLFNMENDGSGCNAIHIPHGGYRNPVTEESLKEIVEGEGITRNKTHLVLNGIDVFNFSVNRVPKNVDSLLQHFKIEKNEIDYFIFHQANKIINDTINKKLKLDPQRVPSSLRDFGNTSSATIPLTIVTQISKEISTRPLRLLFCGFGVGLSWSSLYLETENVHCAKLLEV